MVEVFGIANVAIARVALAAEHVVVGLLIEQVAHTSPV